ncbi:MAG: anaerobic ribonucleoside-triphosphate reductase activating protein [Syntrophomonadaceae bacterium]
MTKQWFDINLAGLIKQSLVDYPGEVAAVLFTRGCNLFCPFCHNQHLVIKTSHPQQESIPPQMVLDFLAARQGFLDGVVITGGEPTIHAGLPRFLTLIKAIGYLIKLDTNGTHPLMLSELLKQRLVDYVAMDIKAPLDFKKYSQAVGKLKPADFLNIKSSINILRNSDIKVEFRTTVVPALHRSEDIEEIARYLEGCELYSLQQFNPTSTLDTSFTRVAPYNRDQMQQLGEQCEKYVKAVRLVNI